MVNCFILFLFFINLFAFIIMYIDKHRAINKKWRISEKNLFLISTLGGSIGIIAGMYTFRHKTKHKKFTIGIPIIFIIEFISISYIIYNY